MKQAATLPPGQLRRAGEMRALLPPLGRRHGRLPASAIAARKAKDRLYRLLHMDQKTYGKCVPVMSIPDAEQKNLGTDNCVKDAQLCVPTEMLQPAFKPPTCSAHNILVKLHRRLPL